MNYTIAVVLCVLEIFLVGMYLHKLDVFSSIPPDGDEGHKPMQRNNWQLFAIIAGIALCLIIGAVLLVNYVSNIVNLAKLLILMGIIAAAAVVDFKKTIIPNLLIVVGMAVRVAIYCIEFFLFRDIFVSQLKSDLIGFAIGFGILFVASVLTKGAIGFGDVKLFGVIGLMSGAICTYSTLLFCLIASSVLSVVLLIARKKKRKDSIPFGPCIFVGYFTAIILSCY